MIEHNINIAQIFKNIDFTFEEETLIQSLFHKLSLKKGDILLKPGERVEAQYFILEGCLRTYHIDTHGKEHTVQFGVKDWWVSDFTGFFSSEKSIMTIEALEDSVIYKLSKEDKDFLYTSIPKIDRFFRIKLERAFAAFQKRILSNLSFSAKERYLDFVDKYPNIEQKVKNYHIASYLGITTESLSRIRRDLSLNEIN